MSIELLIECARARPNDDRVRGAAERVSDWQKVLAAAGEHGMSALVSWYLRRACAELVPAAVLSEFEARFRASVQRNLMFTAELLRLTAAFEAAGIEVVAFKGPAIAWSLYESPALREMSDLDLLVRPGDAERAVELLIAAGYECTYSRDLRFFRSEVPLSSPAGVAVDLHWALAPEWFCHGLDMDRVWTRLAPVEMAGRTVRTLGVEDLLFFLCVHGAKHSWCSLHWLADLARLVERSEIDWDGLIAGARARRISRMVFGGLLLAVEVLGAGVPGRIVAQLRADAGASQLAARCLPGSGGATIGEALGFQFWLLERAADRLRFCWGVAAPALADQQAWALPAALFPLYYGFRPLRLAWKYGARWIRVPDHCRTAGRSACATRVGVTDVNCCKYVTFRSI